MIFDENISIELFQKKSFPLVEDIGYPGGFGIKDIPGYPRTCSKISADIQGEGVPKVRYKNICGYTGGVLNYPGSSI